ncbi:hypothetical protein VP01_1993g1 [Puccinia sorghi]|uniref:Uncharacterized protein n=1 Tax=Puccinia sorghi TaxID=27349 RepID=A0A0L6VBG5_9BASI|nr:hypothetical protein VP01_1993g1 [Puccinia sorghi]
MLALEGSQEPHKHRGSWNVGILQVDKDVWQPWMPGNSNTDQVPLYSPPEAVPIVCHLTRPSVIRQNNSHQKSEQNGFHPDQSPAEKTELLFISEYSKNSLATSRALTDARDVTHRKGACQRSLSTFHPTLTTGVATQAVSGAARKLVAASTAAVAGAVSGPGLATSAVKVLGFQKAGILAGTPAAAFMSSYGGSVSAGSSCAFLQSVGAGAGLGVGGTAVAAVAGGFVAYKVAGSLLLIHGWSVSCCTTHNTLFCGLAYDFLNGALDGSQYYARGKLARLPSARKEVPRLYSCIFQNLYPACLHSSEEGQIKIAIFFRLIASMKFSAGKSCDERCGAKSEAYTVVEIACMDFESSKIGEFFLRPMYHQLLIHFLLFRWAHICLAVTKFSEDRTPSTPNSNCRRPSGKNNLIVASFPLKKVNYLKDLRRNPSNLPQISLMPTTPPPTLQTPTLETINKQMMKRCKKTTQKIFMGPVITLMMQKKGSVCCLWCFFSASHTITTQTKQLKGKTNKNHSCETNEPHCDH